jgi:y4mF family transcriptional regulator
MSASASIPQEIAARVRAERKRQGLDQRTLATIADVAVRSVHRVEQGEATVRFDIVLRVLAALGLEVSIRSRAEVVETVRARAEQVA